ncbi:eukaryotic translation initiation factor 2 alpha subunit-domain-containing protein [Baffinella frigidus]|nr:eukaryotic translation initiation factor 2 alpha subunit-domain-containing protein [Cryptophyta sp. CCMP2293]
MEDWLLVDPSILDKFDLSPDIKTAILKSVELRLTPQPVKIRSDFEVTCFAYEGIDAIKAALNAGISTFSHHTITPKPKPQPLTPPAGDVLCVTCFAYEGIDAIKAALNAGISAGTELNPISVHHQP